jgi:alpha-tubulin suppressor-like RCC1 family protein
MKNQIVVWGENEQNQITSAPLGGLGFSQILPGGSSQTIAIRTNGAVELWGDGSIPKLLYGPMVKPFTDHVIGGAIGLSHFVGILADHSLVCWGNFFDGSSAVPPAGLLAQAVAVGATHGCAIDMNSDLKVWGDTKAPPGGKFLKIRARSDYTIAIHRNGRLYGWGGVFETSEVLTWADWHRDGSGYAYAVGPYIDLAAGPKGSAPKPHILALDANDAIRGWGHDDAGQATGQPAGKFKAIGAGSSYSIALDQNDQLHHWGTNWGHPGPDSPVLGRLGNVPLGEFASISAGSHHATALRLVLPRRTDTAAVQKDG